MLWLLITLQAIQVAILWLHDWAPLAPLNDVKAVRAADPTARLALVTAIQSGPFTVGLAFSLIDRTRGFPGWLWWWLWISYVTLFLGEVRAWWIPYLFRKEPARAARYEAMFGRTHSFLPSRNGIRPNTMHVALHLCTAATLAALWRLTFSV